MHSEFHGLSPYHSSIDGSISSFRWVDAISHVPKNMGLPLYSAKLDDSWFWLGQSLDKHKALIVRENHLGSLGELTRPRKIWDNDAQNTGKGITSSLN